MSSSASEPSGSMRDRATRTSTETRSSSTSTAAGVESASTAAPSPLSAEQLPRTMTVLTISDASAVRAGLCMSSLDSTCGRSRPAPAIVQSAGRGLQLRTRRSHSLNSEGARRMSDAQMRLRYRGTCRLCSNDLPAGTTAIYERTTRTTRCLDCGPPAPAPTTATTVPATAASVATPSPERTPVGDLRLRPPAAAVIVEALRAQESAPPRSGAARLFGVSPLTPESQPWYLGAIGELEVARMLDQLGAEWHVVHAVPVGNGGSDIDHVVVGPGGVFTINSKYHQGQKVWVASKRILVGGHRTDHLRNARHEARRVAKLLTRATLAAVVVRPIIAIVAAREITFKERPEDVSVLRSHQLARWLQRQPTVYSSAETQALARAINDIQTWGAATPVEPDLIAFAKLRESVAAARRRRRVWAVGILALPFAGLALVQLAPLLPF
ncbi:nuclease-related domain-containing protein [Microbacterium limosum]|uniref:Nuclease-related domain-containing protein n=1 Tax=Microbacterium limosum TaxID=3079935 RepID=A0AAU0MIY7_9MICO|nr:nuclease-related domain-containing protein [Microbacterium sp. Y20]WOQ70119.1 nuclease-related domain-containing protein [Microbacterium sp. Y20]